MRITVVKVIDHLGTISRKFLGLEGIHLGLTVAIIVYPGAVNFEVTGGIGHPGGRPKFNVVDIAVGTVIVVKALQVETKLEISC